GPDFAGDDDETGVALDAVPQIAERLSVDPARIEIIGIRAKRERPLAKVIKAFIHDDVFSPVVRSRGPPPVRSRRQPPALPPRWQSALRCTRASNLRENRSQSTESRDCRQRAAGGDRRTQQTRAAATRGYRRRQRSRSA